MTLVCRCAVKKPTNKNKTYIILARCSVDAHAMPPADSEQVSVTRRYWLQPSLPDEQVLLAGTHWEVINRIVPAYNNYVSFGTNVNKALRDEFDVGLIDVLNLTL